MLNNEFMPVNEIYFMDCLAGMRQMLECFGPKSVDFILCDLPYGTTDIKGWDKIIPMDKLWPLYKELIKDDGVIALFGSQPFSSYLVCSNPEMFRYEIIWDKVRGANFLNANNQPLKTHENVLIFSSLPCSPNKKGTAKYFPQRVGDEERIVTSGRRGKRGNINGGTFEKVTSTVIGKHPTSIQRFSKDGTLHPTQKPVSLGEWLIKSFTQELDLVLDNCMGSGTTAIAAMNTERNFIGFENDKQFYDTCIKRISENEIRLEHDQLTLF